MAGGRYVRGVHEALGRALQERTREGRLGGPGQLQVQREFASGRSWDDGRHLVLVPRVKPGQLEPTSLVVLELHHVPGDQDPPRTLRPLVRWIAGDKQRRAALVQVVTFEATWSDDIEQALLEPARAKANERMHVSDVRLDVSDGRPSEDAATALIDETDLLLAVRRACAAVRITLR